MPRKRQIKLYLNFSQPQKAMPNSPAPWQPPPVPPALLAVARNLRARMTDAEQLLWQCLRGKQLDGFKFRKQHPFQQYVLDFYCPAAKLAMELDGSQHNTAEAPQNDATRTAFLARHGIRVLRFWNDQLLQQTDAVLSKIWHVLHEIADNPATSFPQTTLPPMSDLTISPPVPFDASALLAFELAHRAYFESWVNARPASYYTLEAVRAAIDLAAREAAQDRARQFLVRHDGHIIGRVNLTQIQREYYNKAMLGYRIGQNFGGCGFATRAVELVMAVAFDELQLWRVEATVRPENPGSVRVLQHNGFQQFGRATRAMRLHETWSDLLYFECHAPARNAANSL